MSNLIDRDALRERILNEETFLDNDCVPIPQDDGSLDREEQREQLVALRILAILDAQPAVMCVECKHGEAIHMHTDGPTYPACLKRGAGMYVATEESFGCAHFERREP